MTDEEKRRQWFSLLEKSRALLDTPAPEPSTDLFRPDVLEKWAAGMPPKDEPEPVKPTPDFRSHGPMTSAPPVDIHAEIAAALESECAFLIEVMGEALGESLRDARKESADELAAEVRKLWQVLTEMQVTLSALNRMAVTGKGEVLDLPALPRGDRREMN